MGRSLQPVPRCSNSIPVQKPISSTASRERRVWFVHAIFSYFDTLNATNFFCCAPPAVGCGYSWGSCTL